MVAIRKSAERGHRQHGWLDTYHTFSFGDYIDPQQMGFRSLRVLNEDWIEAGQGFGEHGHRDMEILTYVLEGAVAHRDSLGNGSVIRPGELQRMSAGTGILHSEANPSRDEPLHLLQIWLRPDRKGYEPSYEQKAFDLDKARGRWQLVASSDGRDGSLVIHQDARLWMVRLDAGGTIRFDLEPGRHAWLQIARGTVDLESTELQAGDGAAFSDTQVIELRAGQPAELLLFDLA
ncbi:pirin family protein [Singulisphaera acidiphila]|uniref:Pirin-related protein n=1 Tax=Singulisphaera acidiphila (strain ATCC BAA-1392 / DSM 18658 / VKM B-2454 / MOB10) TaxID=886293 RepID=L0DNC2_SINAD|nr:pirin family protein [Singulisphaera acidiphila]AGA30859.1 Pirin-related protein [Singulisphaera acidiphila DSM 18658]